METDDEGHVVYPETGDPATDVDGNEIRLEEIGFARTISGDEFRVGRCCLQR